MDTTTGCSDKQIAVSVIVGIAVMATVTADYNMVLHDIYKTDEGIAVEEDILWTETEVHIRVPNLAKVIYDFKNGLAVQRFLGVSKAQTACYAQYMNETYAPSRVPDANLRMDVEMELDKRKSSETENWRVTNIEVPGNMISEYVAGICFGTKIYWMEKVRDEEINKQTCDSYKRCYLCFHANHPCYYICRFRHFYVTGNVESYGHFCLRDCYPGENNPVCSLH